MSTSPPWAITPQETAADRRIWNSTIIGQECIDEMADLLGLKPQIAAITEQAMSGEIPFEAALRSASACWRALRRGASHGC